MSRPTPGENEILGNAKSYARRSKENTRHCWLNPESKIVNTGAKRRKTQKPRQANPPSQPKNRPKKSDKRTGFRVKPGMTTHLYAPPAVPQSPRSATPNSRHPTPSQAYAWRTSNPNPREAKARARRSKAIPRHSGLDPESRIVKLRREAPHSVIQLPQIPPQPSPCQGRGVDAPPLPPPARRARAGDKGGAGDGLDHARRNTPHFEF
jgi:hypothetical protein